jgi:hypothetical protein
MKGQLASCGLALLCLFGCNSQQEDKQEREPLGAAADIAYDYVFLGEPYRDENHPEEPGKLVADLPLVVYRPDKLNKLEEALADNKPVVVEAARLSGYAESTVLHVVKVLRPEVEKEKINAPES